MKTVYTIPAPDSLGAMIEVYGEPENAWYEWRIIDGGQRKLRTLISRDMATERRRDRDRKRDEARRRAAGAVDRATYEANSASRQKPWESLGMSRASWYRAGKPMPACETGSSPITAAKVERKA